MTRPYTLTFYLRIAELYRRMPAKKVAKLMGCSESMVRVAKHRLEHLKRIVTSVKRESGVNSAP